jgi:hypothetical protein
MRLAGLNGGMGYAEDMLVMFCVFNDRLSIDLLAIRDTLGSCLCLDIGIL